MRNEMIKSQRGQALILIAMAFIGLAAFVGLAVDAGILFANIGHLRKAVDAAALAASTQYRADVTAAQLLATAKEYLALNDIDPNAPTIEIGVCDLPAYDPDWSVFNDPALCKENNQWDYDRKIVRVKAELPVELAFLPVIGIRTVTIKAEAWSEAASVDLVLVLDTSESMGDSDPNWPACNASHTCLPFEYVREAARTFIGKMYYPYDRVAIVTFDAGANVVHELTTNESDLESALDSIELIEGTMCGSPIDPGGCVTTNLTSGLIAGGDRLALPAPDGGRQESLWVVVVLSDGAANQAEDTRDPRPTVPKDPNPISPGWLCPNMRDSVPENYEPTWLRHSFTFNDYGPYCRDGRSETRHDWTDFWYDVEDAAKDAADRLGCYQNSNPGRSTHCSTWDGDKGYGGPGVDDGFEALVFSIGMGPTLLAASCDHNYYDGSDLDHTCEPDLGERLLRYVAAVGDDGNPDTDLCEGAPPGTDCGNYYYRASATDLDTVFDDIAKRIFTRLTH
jgi:Flp pilus assembly protein TadG